MKGILDNRGLEAAVSLPMIGQNLGHYHMIEKLDEEQLDFRTDEKAEPDLPLQASI